LEIAMHRTFLSLFLVQCATIQLIAQGEYIGRGENAFGATAAIFTNRAFNGYALQAGYSYKGFLDAGLLWTKANAGIAGNGILSPVVTFYAVKQEDAERTPTLGLSLGYRHYTASETKTIIVPDPDSTRIDHTSYRLEEKHTVNAIVLDVAAQRRLGYWNVFFFQPMIGAGISFINSGMQFALRGGIAIGARVVHGPLMVMVPCIERESGLTTFLIQLKAIF
jgi:hypothetical protein